MAKQTKPNNETKRRYEIVQTRKLISAYGGVGSIVETPEGAIIVNNFDEWAFFRNKLHENVEHHLEDQRLVGRLRQWFPKIKNLVGAPIPSINGYGQPSALEDKKMTVSARYFPEWAFCPSCHRFDKLPNWNRLWNNTVNRVGDNNDVHPPKCFQCYAAKKGKSRFQELEQIRFILTSPNGRIADIPWERWIFAQIASKKDGSGSENDGDEVENKQRRRLDFTKDIPTDIEFEYATSDKLNDLSGISIIARKRGSSAVLGRKTLLGIFNLRVSESEIFPNIRSRGEMKVVIRSSNSVYYPNILQSLFLPTEKTTITEGVKNFIQKKIERNRTLESIVEDLQDEHKFDISVERLERLIANKFAENATAENAALLERDYRLGEYRFITNKEERYEDPERKLIIEPVPSVNIGMDCLKLYRIDRLKMTSVQTSFTRQEPIDRDYYLSEDQRREGSLAVIRKQYTSKYAKYTTHLPAVESFGEGVFIEFDKKSLDTWLETTPSVSGRIKHIQDNFNNSRGYFEARTIDPKFVLVHTFSHLVIKELEFLCGYPMTSLQERLYISDEMQGVLIYTIAGSEGSYGGLTSLCRSERIGRILQSALHRAKDCAADPICYNTDEPTGQGFGGTNLAACYSCALLPETSCEEFNRFLDRKILVDDETGFFAASGQSSFARLGGAKA